MHLIGDAAVPAHTRNDPHIILDGYEKFVEDTVVNRRQNFNAWISQPVPLDIRLLDPPYNPRSLFPFTKIIDADMYTRGQNPDATLGSGVGMAEYTNPNFVSDDTIFRDYPFPSRESLDPGFFDPPAGTPGARQYFPRARDGERINHFVAEGAFWERLWFRGQLLGGFILDDRVYADYAAKLLPRAVGYSAGLLDYFFRGKLEFEVRPNPADPAQVDLVIWNKSAEPIAGTFTLYADDAQGNRRPVPGASGEGVALTGVEDPNWSTTGSQTITFTPDPSVPLAGLTLVFSGTLGAEQGAVVGKVQPEPILFVIQEQAVLLAAEQSQTWTPRVDGETGKLYDGPSAVAATSRWREPFPQRLSGRFQTADGPVPDGVIDRVGTHAGGTLRLNGVEVGSEWSREAGPALEPRTWEITVAGSGAGLLVTTRAGRTYAGPMVTWGRTSSSADSTVTYDYPYANSIGCDNPLYSRQFSKGTLRQAEVHFSFAFVPVGEVGGYAVGTSLDQVPASPWPESGCPREGVWTGRVVRVFASGSAQVHIGEWVEGLEWVDLEGYLLPPDPPPGNPPLLTSFTFRRQYSAEELQWYQLRNIIPPVYDVRLE